MRTKPLFLMALSLAALSACQSDDDNPVNPIEVKERRDIPLTRSEEVLTDKTIDFSLACSAKSAGRKRTKTC